MHCRRVGAQAPGKEVLADLSFLAEPHPSAEV